MFPLKDENPTEIFPLFTLLLIAANVGAWVYVQGAGFEPGTLMDSVCRYGAVPADLTGQTAPRPAGVETPCRVESVGWAGALTSMFLHGSWLHLIGNVWFLWIFGNNIEDSMGRVRFLVFYLLAGLAAAGAQVLSAPSSPVPMVGASGAISGIMGAYLVLYPRVRVHTLFIIIILIKIIRLPAWLLLGYWFLIQLLLGTQAPAQGAGVAFWAHVGGFVTGVVLVKPFENRQLVSAKRAKRKLPRGEIRGGGWW
jgi:membrane associated rhomboid family serine protease